MVYARKPRTSSATSSGIAGATASASASPVPGRPSMLRRMVRPRWVDLIPRVLGAQESALPPHEARDWALVLASARLPHRIVRQGPLSPTLSRVQVQGWALRRAEEEIEAWLRENRTRPEQPLPPVVRTTLWPTVGAMLLLVLLHFFFQADHMQWGLRSHDFYDLGSAWAQGVRQGQWWRLITALTLHGDGAHVVGNAVVGGVFLALASQRLGAGLAWILVLASGAAGNWINALVAAPVHDSVGFSTAVFGAAGLLAGLRMVDKLWGGQGGRLVELLIPLGAGLGILAMLGSGGDNTDLGAHLFGLGAGVLLGLAGGLAVRRMGMPGKPWQAALGALCMVGISLAWRAALSAA